MFIAMTKDQTEVTPQQTRKAKQEWMKKINQRNHINKGDGKGKGHKPENK